MLLLLNALLKIIIFDVWMNQKMHTKPAHKSLAHNRQVEKLFATISSYNNLESRQ